MHIYIYMYICKFITSIIRIGHILTWQAVPSGMAASMMKTTEIFKSGP